MRKSQVKTAIRRFDEAILAGDLEKANESVLNLQND